MLKTFRNTPGNRTGGRWGTCVSSFTRHHQMFFQICADLCLYRINESLCFSPFLTLSVLWRSKIFAYLMGVKNSVSLLLWFALDWFLVSRTSFFPPYIYSLCRFPCQWIICSFSLCILLLSFCFLVGILHILQKPHLNQLLLFLICALDFNLVSLCPETLLYYHQIYPFVFSCSLYFFVCLKKSFPTWRPKIYFSIFSIKSFLILFFTYKLSSIRIYFCIHYAEGTNFYMDY